MAWIWFSCFCSASENLRLMPAAVAASLTEVVLAERQPDSEPTWEKPRVIVFWAPPLAPALVVPVDFLPQAASEPPTTTRPAAPAAPVRNDRLLIIFLLLQGCGV